MTRVARDGVAAWAIGLGLASTACGGPSLDGAPDAAPRDAAPDTATLDPPDASGSLDAPDGLADVEPGEALPAGTATTFDLGRAAFRQYLTGLTGEARTRYLAGQALFELDWVAAPAGNSDRDGLGPTFNAASCRACHPDNGRGAPPLTDGPLVTALVRLSTLDGAPHPIYGDQLQPRAIAGVSPEGQAELRTAALPGQLADGTPYELLQPTLELHFVLDAPGGLATSVRTAPALIGQGLLEAIPAAAITDAADPDDRDGDGISGRARWLSGADGPVLGRFGWKAGQPTVTAQNAAALLGDLGITTAELPAENCPPAQTACAAAPTGGSPELDAARTAALRAFIVGTSVPARRDVDAVPVRRGKQLFHELACARCHTPRWRTGAHDFPGVADQAIWPYTDLLLHDLGDALADHRAEGDASGREWRTPPLWGIGLLPIVNGHQRLLHDGRARGVIEAILWHGGEAESAAARFRALAAADRAALEAFLISL